MNKFLKAHKVLISFLSGALLSFLITYGLFWWFTPEMSTDMNSLRSFDDCSLAGFATYKSAENELTCVLPNGNHFSTRHL